MKKILELITDQVEEAFSEKGFDRSYGKVKLSDRPDLCEFQCNGAMAAAKAQHCAPFLISDQVAEALSGNPMFQEVQSVKPGFLNLKLDETFLANYLNEMQADEERCGVDRVGKTMKMIIDYGGPNVAKPLHVGHLRPAIIGESIKRMCRFMGHTVIGDVHIGDWGLQMGLIITELKERQPKLVYFDEDYQGEYPEEAPFTISELEEIYPTASKKSKEPGPEGESYKAKAMQATFDLQKGRRGYTALWQKILEVSVTDLKKNYERLNVSFDLWKGESDADPYIPEMVQKMKDDGFAYISEGALVVDVKEDSDTKNVPPCMILKSDGASLYNTTDLATMVWRMRDYHPDEMIYVVDKRQELYFTQVFRCARKTGIVNPETKLVFKGFGTVNGKNGKALKTRDGGVLRLEYLLQSVADEMYAKIEKNHIEKGEEDFDREEARQTAEMTALAAIKYGDLSNQVNKDYVFDTERFTSFEGNTGPYILYTIVRIKSILNRYAASGKNPADCRGKIMGAHSKSEKALMLAIAGFGSAVETACRETAPHKLCAYVYELANALNGFYHDTRILAETDETMQQSYIALLFLTEKILETGIDLLGFSAPERM